MQRREFLRILRWLPVSGGAAAAAAATAYGHEDGAPEMPPPPPPPKPGLYEWGSSSGYAAICVSRARTEIHSDLAIYDFRGRHVGLQPGKDGHLWLKIADKWRRIVTE